MSRQNREILVWQCEGSQELLADQVVHAQQCQAVILFVSYQEAAQVSHQVKPKAVGQTVLDLGDGLLQAHIQHTDSHLA